MKPRLAYHPKKPKQSSYEAMLGAIKAVQEGMITTK